MSLRMLPLGQLLSSPEKHLWLSPSSPCTRIHPHDPHYAPNHIVQHAYTHPHSQAHALEKKSDAVLTLLSTLFNALSAYPKRKEESEMSVVLDHIRFEIIASVIFALPDASPIPLAPEPLRDESTNTGTLCLVTEYARYGTYIVQWLPLHENLSVKNPVLSMKTPSYCHRPFMLGSLELFTLRHGDVFPLIVACICTVVLRSTPLRILGLIHTGLGS
jgi:hypothetical protein